MSNITKDQVIEWLSAQSVLDVANLVKDLETKCLNQAQRLVRKKYAAWVWMKSQKYRN